MPKNINRHVTRLNRFLPFSPSHDQIYEEYQRSEDSLNLETRALAYARMASDRDADLIILTGDAGHGKTHLCRRLLELKLGYDEDEARELINRKCDGVSVIPHKNGEAGGRGLRVFKDFSELPIDSAAARLEKLSTEHDAVTVICANEGRLRAVLESASSSTYCQSLLDEFNSSFRDGLASRTGKIHIINMNFQSVAASSADHRSLVVETIHDWTSGTRWRVCGECDSRDSCPILANQKMLGSQSGEETDVRRRNIEALFSTTERLGTVVTIREMLMVVAYLLTTGLDCEQVHKLAEKKKGWQHPYAYYNNLFCLPPKLSAEKLRRIPVLSALRKLDPGMRSSRKTDEKIINDQDVFPQGEIDLAFQVSSAKDDVPIDAANGIDEIIGNPRNRKERSIEAKFVESVVRSLRRRAFFDGVAGNSQILEHLGFREGGKFSEVIEGELTPKRVGELKRSVIAGLHTIQGLQLGENHSELNLVDPAFGSATSRAAIIADTVAAKDIRLIPLSGKWDIAEGLQEYSLPNSVNWLDRHVVLRISDDEPSTHDLLLDLVAFDCIVRAGGGYVAEEFYAHDIRRIRSFLGQLAETRKAPGDAIKLFLGGSSSSVSIDDGMIQVSSGG